METDLWGVVEAQGWREVPCLLGRVATEDDVKAGRATFYIRTAHESDAHFVDIGIPHCAIWTNEKDERVPVVIIQSESANGDHYIGFRFLDGGNGVGLFFEFQLFDEPNELFQ